MSTFKDRYVFLYLHTLNDSMEDLIEVKDKEQLFTLKVVPSNFKTTDLKYLHHRFA